jgi:hypothetical protein
MKKSEQNDFTREKAPQLSDNMFAPKLHLMKEEVLYCDINQRR